MEAKVRKIAAGVFIALLCVIYLVYHSPLFLLDSRPAGMLLHHFFHVNWLHLVVNCYATFVLLSRRGDWREILAAYIIASLSFICSPHPSIGMSNFLYALMGLRTPSFSHSWWKSANTIIFLAFTVGYLFVPGISALTHMVSFAGGVCAAMGRRVYHKTFSDYGKASKRRFK